MPDEPQSGRRRVNLLSFIRHCRNGNVALNFAIVAPLLLAAAGFGVDFQARLSQESQLQDAADNLALRAAREMLLQNATASTVEALVRAWADAQYAQGLGPFTITPEVDDAANTATVNIAKAPAAGFFLTHLASKQDRMIEVSATAQAQGVTNVCVIALEDEAGDAIRASSLAKLTAPKCAILSNSTSSSGVNISNSAKLTAGMICSAGGAAGASMNFDPQPVTDCPVYDDPLAGRTPPASSGCDSTNMRLGDVPQSISGAIAAALAASAAAVDGSNPNTLTGFDRYDIESGVYCGGLEINAEADVHLAPGIYVIKDGPLKIGFGSRLYGENVGFYFEGDKASFTFEPASIIHLTAPKEGLMAGLLFWDSKDAPESKSHYILSSNARQLLGTIYLPRSRLEIASLKPVADQSAYTAIVARTIKMSGTPTLVLNANYAATDIPVPNGIGPTGGQVFLRE